MLRAAVDGTEANVDNGCSSSSDGALPATMPRITDIERHQLRVEARHEYERRLAAAAAATLQCDERAARDTLVALADAAHDTLRDAAALALPLHDACPRELAWLQARLRTMQAQRQCSAVAAHDAAAALAREAAMLRDGRAAWRAEQATEAARARAAATAAAAARRAELCLQRALTFVRVRERDARADVVAAEAAARPALAAAEQRERAAAAAAAHTRWYNSDEQVAARAEQERLAQLARKRAVRAARLHRAQQERLVQGCRHGRGGASLFVGPAPQRVCGKCRVRYDDERGCYVSMDATPATGNSNNNNNNNKASRRESGVTTTAPAPLQRRVTLPPLPPTATTAHKQRDSSGSTRVVAAATAAAAAH